MKRTDDSTQQFYMSSGKIITIWKKKLVVKGRHINHTY